MGFDAGKPDGMSGPKTRSATRQYQIINDIPADGYVGQTLLQQLTPVD
jgi:membrane-bound lytic murein transglycosylase B